MKKLRIGMVGAGFISDWHYKAFASLADAEFAGMCSGGMPDDEARRAADQALLEKKCREWGIRAYPNFEAIVSDPSLDALIIGSINPCHFEQILSGLNARKHLLVEKPVVTDFAQLDEVGKLGRSVGRVVFPGHNFVYRGAVRQAKEILAGGALGRLIRSSFVSSHLIPEAHATGWRARRELSKGGALMDSGHHLVYQMLYLLGVPSALQAFCSRLALQDMECEDTAQVSVQFTDGSLGCVMQSWASGKGDQINGIRILGDKGNLVISDALYLNGEKLNDDAQYGDSFEHQARAFVNSVRSGTPPLSTLDDVRDTLKFIFAAYESSDRVTHFEYGGSAGDE